MPKVTVYTDSGSMVSRGVVGHLRPVCQEIVPAALNTKLGKLTPGSIVYIDHTGAEADLGGVDIMVDVEAYDYPDRGPAEQRAEVIRKALEGLFPGYVFAVWVKLLNAGWSSGESEPGLDDDMSMRAAIDRARYAIGR